MPQPNDLSRSLVALDQNSTMIAVVELSQSSWLVAGMLPGIERQPCKKLEPSPERLLALLHRWQDEAAGPAARSRGLRWPLKPAATASGWRAGLRRVAEALRRAMMAMLDPKNPPKFAHPLAWTPFVLAGEGGAGR